MEEDATCSLCMGVFTDPVSLSCCHGFCRGCLESLAGQITEERRGKTSSSKSTNRPCPTCRAEAPLETHVDCCRSLKTELEKLQTELVASQKTIETKSGEEYERIEMHYGRSLNSLQSWRKSERDKVDDKRATLTRESLSLLKSINLLIEETDGLMTSSAELLSRNEALFLLESKELRERLQCHSSETNKGLEENIQKMKELQSMLSRCDFLPYVMKILSQGDACIEEYFYAGYSQSEIIATLCVKHNITISLRTLGRILKRRGLGRNHNRDQVRAAVRYELAGSGSYIGCRALTRRLLSKYGIRASRKQVLALQHQFDPEGVAIRTAHGISRRTYTNPGPNHCIHIDGYDKLKPYGFPIHGAVDGFSRRVLWLKVGRTNNNPAVVATNFIDYVQNIQAVPRILRTDAGTENVDILDIQVAFRTDHADALRGERSVIVGSSHSNQRVERWWSTMRGNGVGYWIDMFRDMVAEGVYSTADPVQIECARFCFSKLLQTELTQIQHDWNEHRIRPCRLSGFCGGKPDILYFTPEIFGTTDHKVEVDLVDILAVKKMYEDKQPPEDHEFQLACRNLLISNRKSMPQDCSEAKELFVWLVQQF